MKRVLLVLGLVLILTSVLVNYVVVPRLNVRFPDGWAWSLTTFGTNLYPDDKGIFAATKKFPADDDVAVSDRIITVSHQNAPAGSVSVDDHYVSKDPNTGAVTWDFTYHAIVDPVTGQYTEDKFKGDYYFFPRNVSKDATYRVRNTSYPGLPVTFRQESVVNGLPTFEYAYLGTYDNTAAYPDQKLQPGQTIQCTNLELRYWVEPLTGEVVKYVERCNADAVIETATSKPVTYLSRWSGEVKSDSIIAQVNAVTAKRNAYLWISSYIPLMTGAAGVLLLAAGLVLTLSQRAPVSRAMQPA